MQVQKTGDYSQGFCNYNPKETSLKSQAIFDRAFKDISESQWHFLFMDRHTWISTDPIPVVNFDTFYEKGYLDALHSAFKNVIRMQIGVRYDAGMFCQLRDACVNNAFRDHEGETPFIKGYCEGCYYDLDDSGMTDEAFDELKQIVYWSYETNPVKDFEYLSSMNSNCPSACVRIRSAFTDKSQLPRVTAVITGLFDTYYSAIESSNSNDDKLAAIANLCRALELIHAFVDGNGRTILFALLPKLLIENGFPPAIVDNPHKCFTGYSSTKEMVAILKQGMKNYQKLTEQLKTMQVASKINNSEAHF